MPSTLNPTHYERANSIMETHYDSFFKLATTEADDWTGEVDAPVGVVTLVRLTDEDLGRMVNEHGLYTDPIPGEGWYVTRQDSSGLIWAMYYGSTEYTLSEENARADYMSADEAYSEWAGDDEEETDEPVEADLHTFEVQVGKGKGKYKSKYIWHQMTLESSVPRFYYNCINTHSGHKKRLLMDGKVIDRVIS